jgi:hypothetical protein
MTKCELINIIKPHVKCSLGSLWAKEKRDLIRIYNKLVIKGIIDGIEKETA